MFLFSRALRSRGSALSLCLMLLTLSVPNYVRLFGRIPLVNGEQLIFHLMTSALLRLPASLRSAERQAHVCEGARGYYFCRQSDDNARTRKLVSALSPVSSVRQRQTADVSTAAAGDIVVVPKLRGDGRHALLLPVAVEAAMFRFPTPCTCTAIGLMSAGTEGVSLRSTRRSPMIQL